MNVFFSFLLSIGVGVIITSSCIYLLSPVAMHIGLVDAPGGRKTHHDTIPLIGGIAMFLGFCFALLCLNIPLHHYRALLAGSAILILLGVIDDFRELSPRIRLFGQFFVALLLIEWGHLSLTHLGNLFFLGNANLGVYSLFFTILFILAFVNSINMIDGHDGLAGLIALSQAFFIIVFDIRLHQTWNVYLLSIFISVLSTFLFFNLPLLRKKQASIFMGDAGSTFVGFVIVWFALELFRTLFGANNHSTVYNPITLLWFLAYPLYDLLSVTVHRLLRHESPFSASRDHLHHLLVDSGLKGGWTTFSILFFSLALSFLGILLAKIGMPEPWQMVTFSGIFGLYFAGTFMLKKLI